MLNQYLDENISNTQMSLFCFPPDFSTMALPLFGYHRSTTMSNYDFNAYDNDIPKQDHHLKLSHFGVDVSQLPFQRSIPSSNFWACGDVLKTESMSSDILKRSLVRDENIEKYQEQNIGVSSSTMKNNKNKKINLKAASGKRKMTAPRFSFKTMSDVDVLDDGYKWRKYGQKVVKDTHHPRSYYRCTQDNCRVKKRVERLAEDPRMVITTYEGRHMHSPNAIDDNNGDHTLEF